MSSCSSSSSEQIKQNNQRKRKFIEEEKEEQERLKNKKQEEVKTQLKKCKELGPKYHNLYFDHVIKMAKELLHSEHSKFFFTLTSRWLKRENKCYLFNNDISDHPFTIQEWISPTKFRILVNEKQNLSTIAKWNRGSFQWRLPHQIMFDETTSEYKIQKNNLNTPNYVSFRVIIAEYFTQKNWAESYEEIKLIPNLRKCCQSYDLFFQDPEKYYSTPSFHKSKVLIRNWEKCGFCWLERFSNFYVIKTVYQREDVYADSFYSNENRGDLYSQSSQYILDPYGVFSDEKKRQELEKLKKSDVDHELFDIPNLTSIIGDFLSS